MLEQLGIDELKRRLKQWERSFVEESGRRPATKDVDRDPEIRRLYQRYSELRSLSWEAAPVGKSPSTPASTPSITSELGAKLLNSVQQRRLSRVAEPAHQVPQSTSSSAEPKPPEAAPPPYAPPPPTPAVPPPILQVTESPRTPAEAVTLRAAKSAKPAACRFAYLSGCQLDKAKEQDRPTVSVGDELSNGAEYRNTYSGFTNDASLHSVTKQPDHVAKQLDTVTKQDSAVAVQPDAVAKQDANVAMQQDAISKETFDFIAKPTVVLSSTVDSAAADKENLATKPSQLRKSVKRPAVLSDDEQDESMAATKPKPAKKQRSAAAAATKPPAVAASSFACAAPSVASSSSSANYVKVNLRVKRFSRGGAGKGQARFRRFKHAEWKRKSRLNGAGANRCFACGEEGHWADKCPRPKPGWRNNGGGGKPIDEEEEQIGDLGDFGDIASMTTPSSSIGGVVQRPAAPPAVNLAALEAGRPAEFPGDLRSVQRAQTGAPAPAPIEPLADEVPKSEVRALLRRFGHADFRPGQAEAVSRVLAGQSALVVMATGAGKSLCYQLPALLYHGRRNGAVALVISPLQALMEDQLTRLPSCLPAACLHSGQSAELRDRIRADAAAGRLACLLVSPEMLVDGAVSLRLPAGVSFACIDEAHCLADWSHHFRPAYLRVLSVLRSVYSVRCFLGLTATAGPETARSVARLLGADPLLNPGPPLPSNLRLSASSAGYNKTEALLQLLATEPYKSSGSILIYCGSRAEADAVAGLLRTSHGGSAAARAYHAGMSASERRRAQKAFTTGKCRILAATVALGMGLDKPDVRCVLHYSPPASYRDYVQEVGRAGRDGQPAFCHTLLAHPPGADLLRLQRHVFANCVETAGVKTLIRRLFPVLPDCRLCEPGVEAAEEADAVECAEGAAVGSQSWPPGGHLRALNIAEIVAELDATEETIETLLCYLQLRFPGRCRLLGRANSRYRLSSYSGPAGLAWAASRCLCVAVALADRAADADDDGDSANPTIDLAAVCDRFGWDPAAVGRDLDALEWNENGRRSGVVAKPDSPAWMLLTRCCRSHEVADRLAGHVCARLRRVELAALSDMRRLHRLLARAAKLAKQELNGTDEGRVNGYGVISNSQGKENSALSKPDDAHSNGDGVLSNGSAIANDDLHDAASRAISSGIYAYFADGIEGGEVDANAETEGDDVDDDDAVDESTLSCVRAGVRAFIGLYGDEHRLTARNIACVMHGIGTPNFPAVVWGRVRRFWRLHEAVPWPAVRRAALEELLARL